MWQEGEVGGKASGVFLVLVYHFGDLFAGPALRDVAVAVSSI